MKIKKIETDKRIVTNIITDIQEDLTYDALKAIIVSNDIPMDGLLIEMNSRKGYVWEYKNKSRLPSLPTTPDDAPTPMDMRA